MIDFKSAKERDEWIIDHADYFTVIRRRNRSYLREECSTLAGAKAKAEQLLKREDDKNARCMIYAVANNHDAYVCTVSKEST